MPAEFNVGEVSVSSKGVHWTIRNFSQLPQIHNTTIGSPSFQFKNRRWCLYIYPNGHRIYSSLDWLGIVAVTDIRFTPNECDIHLGIADKYGRSIVSSRAKLEANYYWYQSVKVIPYAEFKSRKCEFMPDGTLHVLLSKMNEEPESTFHAGVNTVEGGKEQKQKFDHESQDVSTQTEEGVGKKWSRPNSKDTCVDVFTQTEEINANEEEHKQKQKISCREAFTQTEEQIVETGTKESSQEYNDTYEEESQQSVKQIEIWQLKKDFKKMLFSGSISNVVLKVGSEESRAHKCILASFSPVFLTVIIHESKENISSVINIKDIDLEAFPDFLNFLFTGSIEKLTFENALKLCVIAVKYKIEKLKRICTDNLLVNIDSDNFCDVLFLSFEQNEKDLKEACFQYYLKNSLVINRTTKWRTFLTENPVICSELLIKYSEMSK